MEKAIREGDTSRLFFRSRGRFFIFSPPSFHSWRSFLFVTIKLNRHWQNLYIRQFLSRKVARYFANYKKFLQMHSLCQAFPFAFPRQTFYINTIVC